jgi:small subunit ribosomal protein S8
MTDTIADLINRINSTNILGKESFSIPFSKLKLSVLSALEREGYISSFKDDKESGLIEIVLDGSRRQMKLIRRMSKPGRRLYARSTNIPRPKNGNGIVIMSTPEGVLSGREAFKAGVGGEIICEVF